MNHMHHIRYILYLVLSHLFFLCDHFGNPVRMLYLFALWDVIIIAIVIIIICIDINIIWTFAFSSCYSLLCKSRSYFHPCLCFKSWNNLALFLHSHSFTFCLYRVLYIWHFFHLTICIFLSSYGFRMLFVSHFV